MFSMDSDILPFNPTWTSFLITTLILASMLVVILLGLRIRLRQNIKMTFQNNLKSTRSYFRRKVWSRSDAANQKTRTPSADESDEQGVELNNLQSGSIEQMA